MSSLSHSFRCDALIWLGAVLCCTAADRQTLRVCADPNNLPFSNVMEEGLENKLAQLIAHDLSADLKYVWFSQRKNFLKNSLNANLCDVVLGVPVDVSNALLTRPYYRSTYVMVTKADRGLKIDSLYASALKELRIGLHMVDDDYAPPGHLLAAQGLSSQIVGYSLHGAYNETNPPARLIEGVAKGDVDVAITWGPLAGYFAKRSRVMLAVQPVSPSRFQMIPFVYAIGVAVRKGDIALHSAIQKVLDKECPRIRELVKEYAFPWPERCPVMRYVAIGCCLLTLIACKRESHEVRPSPAVSGVPGDAHAESALFPGGGTRQQEVRNPYEGNAYAISEGQRLFNWYNCSGCHANGGGGIGPPLIKMDQGDWIYGGAPSNIFDTVAQGRPNGMPTWGGKIPEYQIWQIVTYVRSLNNLEPRAATPARPDSLEQKSATILPDKPGAAHQ